MLSERAAQMVVFAALISNIRWRFYLGCQKLRCVGIAHVSKQLAQLESSLGCEACATYDAQLYAYRGRAKIL